MTVSCEKPSQAVCGRKSRAGYDGQNGLKRQQIFSQIHHIYLTDFPFITLYFPLDVAVVRKGTHNYQPSPFTGEIVDIWEWWCDQGKC